MARRGRSILGKCNIAVDRPEALAAFVETGTDDPIVPVANGRILASLIPDVRLVTIDDGHLFLVTSPANPQQ